MSAECRLPRRSTTDLRPTARPADGVLHPVALIALAVLVLNDQVLKAAWPGFVTGKLSDIAGLIVAPLALQAAWEVGDMGVGRWRGPSLTVLAVSIAVVGLGFAAVQIWEPATMPTAGASARTVAVPGVRRCGHRCAVAGRRARGRYR